MRRALLSRTVVAASTVTVTATRNMFVFSQQSKILTDNQKALNSDSNVWIEDWEVKRSNINVLKNAPTTVSLEKALELYNFNDLENPPDQLEMPVHTSYSTSKPYGRKLQLELSDRAVKQSYSSKLWIPVGQARKQGLALRQGARPTVVLTGGSVVLHHTSNLENGEVLQRSPVSGGSRRVYQQSSRQYQVLSEAVAINSYQTGLFFTKKQYQVFGLTPIDNTTPVSISIPNDKSGGLTYYNLDQLLLPQVALESLNRTEPSEPSFLLSGEPVRNKENLPQFSSNYWLSSRDAQMYHFDIKPSELSKGVILASRTNTIEMWNAEQFTDPNAAFSKAGLFVTA
ncbi:mitochondrial RNA-binding protein, putative [Bodo saltans]|uniref:Mitochondrial RNA-binding protein, putative n=1 Tax=Bodo saltans TaxID=75058 RepID=A0A0S4IYJ9_BODSA|nr:mitochondrial RNA-binding protein, putative [Bodo saltans]|eukprot:CUF99171.1 mitochondrial RNA-binding protein, putative [Bodo saltans]